jgi:hypothetical protein
VVSAALAQLASSVDVAFEPGMLASDIWVATVRQVCRAAIIIVSMSAMTWAATVRQHSFSLRQPMVYGVSSRTYLAYADVYASGGNTALHPDFTRAVERLPADMSEAGAAEAYKSFVDEYGTHFVARELFGGRLQQEFYVRQEDYLAHNETVRAEAARFFDERIGHSIAAAVDNADHYHGLLNESVRLDSLHFTARGGDPGSAHGWDAWVASMKVRRSLLKLSHSKRSDTCCDGRARRSTAPSATTSSWASACGSSRTSSPTVGAGSTSTTPSQPTSAPATMLASVGAGPARTPSAAARTVGSARYAAARNRWRVKSGVYPRRARVSRQVPDPRHCG